MTSLSREEIDRLKRCIDEVQRQKLTVTRALPDNPTYRPPNALRFKQMRINANIANGLRYVDDDNLICDTCGWAGSKFTSKHIRHNDGCKYKQ